ncbi:SDR family NAD(P)-dependent oxidoreductase [Actinomadura fibrosa]|uniref:SDR family NAD(P)-dependent oxidoreductase n=1 Tax=Actinomadura fibrosa TaxID=111802 RepID=A0ABW2Y164_9ACTN|nr:SDR family NAD(P)-dependent oxidoreductase [Actinomadura fibrosa]
MTDLTGKTVVITGASSGIGAAAARRFADLGAGVVPVGRSPERTEQVAAQIGAEPFIADFAHLEQVRHLASTLLERLPRIDVLANNAGALVPSRRVTADGHELTFQANHLAPFLLTHLLLPRLRESAQQGPVRVVTTSSLGNRFGRLRMDDLEWEKRRYGEGWIAYSTTKLMNILFTRELARRNTEIEAFSFNPDPGRRKKNRDADAVATRFAAETRLGRLIVRTPLRRIRLTGDDGAGPLVWLATSPEVGGASGAYFDGFAKDAKVHRQADDPGLAAQLWERSAELVKPYI